MDAQLEYNLKQLKLPAFLSNYIAEADTAIKNKSSYAEYLKTLSQIEVDRRFNQLIERRLLDAKFPVTKTLDTFDFSAIPSLKKETIFELANGYFTENAKNIILFGHCGTGKTHLAIALGRELCLKKYRVYFNNLCNFINDLLRANKDLALHRFFKNIQKYDLVILDELGYVPFEQHATNLLFQFFAEQYERKSLLVTTNLAFSQWDQIFKEKQTTVAAVDRLIHHGIVIEFKADSYRLKSSVSINKKR